MRIKTSSVIIIALMIVRAPESRKPLRSACFHARRSPSPTASAKPKVSTGHECELERSG
jgi:hypothetical protein